MKKTIVALVLLILSAGLHADCIPFRSGILLAAELSTAPQKIQDFAEEDHPALPQQNRAYASVTLSLHPGRQLSLHDYSLRVCGIDYKCVAIRTGNGPWQAVSGDITTPAPGEWYAMLFILDGGLVGISPKEELILKCNYPPAKYSETALIFTNCGKNNFTPKSKIPKTGSLTLKK